MTTFVISHNLQIQSETAPPFELSQLAKGLQSHSTTIETVKILEHPHWILLITSKLEPLDLANELVQAWINLRNHMGHQVDHDVLALGGRKDTPGSPGSPLKEGYWGVDLVETLDSVEFLAAINWAELKKGRPVDGVFEFSS